MEKNNSEKWAKVKAFFKKNGYYFLIVLCIGAVATMVGVAVSQSKKGQDTNISITDDSKTTIGGGEQDKPSGGEQDKPAPTEPDKEPEKLEITNVELENIVIAPNGGNIANLTNIKHTKLWISRAKPITTFTLRQTVL